jgi:hypothetical protein
MRAYLEHSPAAIVLAQELHIADPDGVATATAWARARGWQTVNASHLKRGRPDLLPD